MAATAATTTAATTTAATTTAATTTAAAPAQAPSGRHDACIIFDCDGVLVDVSQSYYRAIRDTVAYVMANAPRAPDSFGIDAGAAASRRAIDRFKDAGMFNDEVDVACALAVSAAVSHDLGMAYDATVDQMAEGAGPGGIASVISYAEEIADVSDVVRFMGHPSPDRAGLLCDVFDRVFYGPLLYQKVRGGSGSSGSSSQGADKAAGPVHASRGGIESDNVIVTEQVLSALSDMFGPRMALVTGRGLAAASHTLEPYLGWFDVKNSAFLEDEPRAHAKPNPLRLDECIRGMGCSRAVYVGDSVEDAVMARRASSDVTFVGIVGTCSDPDRRRALLEKNGAAVTLESVLDIPGALNPDEW